MRGQRHVPAALYPRERPGTHCTGGWVGPRAGLDRCRKSCPPPGFDHRTVQPIASRYTDCATRLTVRPIGGSRGIALLFHDQRHYKGVSGQHHAPAALYPRENSRYPMYRRLGGPQGRSAQMRKISPPPGFDPRTDPARSQSLNRLSYRAHAVCRGGHLERK